MRPYERALGEDGLVVANDRLNAPSKPTLAARGLPGTGSENTHALVIADIVLCVMELAKAHLERGEDCLDLLDEGARDRSGEMALALVAGVSVGGRADIRTGHGDLWEAGAPASTGLSDAGSIARDRARLYSARNLAGAEDRQRALWRR